MRKISFPLLYKKGFSGGTIQNEYVNAEQSSLYYLRDYLQVLVMHDLLYFVMEGIDGNLSKCKWKFRYSRI